MNSIITLIALFIETLTLLTTNRNLLIQRLASMTLSELYLIMKKSSSKAMLFSSRLAAFSVTTSVKDLAKLDN